MVAQNMKGCHVIKNNMVIGSVYFLQVQ